MILKQIKANENKKLSKKRKNNKIAEQFGKRRRKATDF
jgi:hypothetical protein